MAKGDKKPVVMTEDIDQSVAKKLHAAQHASGGSDPITPAAINALNKAGDTMTDALKFAGSDDTLYGIMSANYYNAYLSAYNNGDTANRFLLSVFPKWRGGLKNAVNLFDYTDGVETIYPILHTGNKPAASYTGNMSMPRTIYTGGTGDTIIIRTRRLDGSPTSTHIMTGDRTIRITSDGSVSCPTDYGTFWNGVLTITHLNINGGNDTGMFTYEYQVL